jgi:iron complex outermembrane receptor protein
VLLVETRRAIHPEAAAWAASHGERGLRIGGSLGRLTATASGSRLADDFPYTVPIVRGGGEATRRNAGGGEYDAALTLTGPVELVARATASERGLPGTTTNPTPSAHAGDRSVQVGARTDGRFAASASLEWIESMARDPAPPTGLPYESDTHGLGGTATLGHHLPMSVGPWRGSVALTAEGGADRFGGDEVRSGTSFTRGALRANARLVLGPAARWTLAPAARLDGWTGATTPRLSARVDAGWQRGGTALTLGAGSAVTPPVLADLFFREGVGVRVNPDLRPERVRWEIEGGIRHELRGGPALGLRLFAGQVADMIIWAPDFRFIWSPRNFDVVRRGGELTLDWAARSDLRLTGGGTYAAVTYDTPGGAQVEYRPRVTYDGTAVWSPGSWALDVRWHRIGRRYPNSAGTNPRDAFSLLDAGLERRLGGGLSVRGEVRDITDERAEFLAGYPTPGRAFALTLTMVAP